MESAEIDLVDIASDPTGEVAKVQAAEPAKPERMPSGTLAPPLRATEADDGLDALRAEAEKHHAAEAWEDLAQTLRSIIDLGQLQDVIGEQEMLELHAQLGAIEGDRLGRTDAAIRAWREVLAIDASDLGALTALESLYERDGDVRERLEVLEKRALLIDDEDERRAMLLEAAMAWDDELDNRERAAELYERLRAADPSNLVVAERLCAIYRHQREWATLVEVLLERSELVEGVPQQIELLHEVAAVYERELGDAESAFYVVQAAFNRDHRHAHTVRELQRLAAEASLWQELLDEHTKHIGELEREDPRAAADLWVKIGRWYVDELSQREYALHSMQQALRLEPAHAGALAAVAALQPSGSDAIAVYQQALLHDPSSPDALAALERHYRQQEAWEPLVDILVRRARVTVEDRDIAQLQLEIGSICEHRLDDTVQAVTAYAKVLEVEPENLRALRALEGLYEKTSQYEKYLGVLEAQLAVAAGNGERISLLERIAATYEERFNDLPRAAAAYEQIIEIDARSYAAYHLLARLYQQAGNHEAAAETHRKHIAATTDLPTQVELHVELGRIYAKHVRDVDRAIEAYTDALALDPDEPHALEALADLYEQLGAGDSAARMLERIVQAADDAKKPELFWRLGRLQYKFLGEPAAAEASLLRALALAPAHVASMEALIEQYSDRGDWLKAAQMMTRAEVHSQVAVDKVRLLTGAANIHLHQLRAPDQARELYAAAIAIDPEHVEAGRALAGLYFDAAQWKELSPVIEMLCRKAAQLRADARELHELHFRAARCADELGEHAKALGYYTTASDIDSLHVPTLLGRADLLFKMQSWDQAGQAFQTLLFEHRDGLREFEIARSYHRLGQVLQKLGHRKKALAMFDKALELAPHDHE
ncbi:MAG: tetratricopeptide repeat protein, partial [Deltaproteobacteria bacterium]|nr:tetratricopeptide repeat protein [Deltaproteobacteria bacterium]